MHPPKHRYASARRYLPSCTYPAERCSMQRHPEQAIVRLCDMQGEQVLLASTTMTVLPGPVEPSACTVQLLPSPGWAATSSTTLQVRWTPMLPHAPLAVLVQHPGTCCSAAPLTCNDLAAQRIRLSCGIVTWQHSGPDRVAAPEAICGRISCLRPEQLRRQAVAGLLAGMLPLRVQWNCILPACRGAHTRRPEPGQRAGHGGSLCRAERHAAGCAGQRAAREPRWAGALAAEAAALPMLAGSAAGPGSAQLMHSVQRARQCGAAAFKPARCSAARVCKRATLRLALLAVVHAGSAQCLLMHAGRAGGGARRRCHDARQPEPCQGLPGARQQCWCVLPTVSSALWGCLRHAHADSPGCADTADTKRVAQQQPPPGPSQDPSRPVQGLPSACLAAYAPPRGAAIGGAVQGCGCMQSPVLAGRPTGQWPMQVQAATWPASA